MGNTFEKIRSRRTMCTLINKLPNWFFGRTRRIALNQIVLKLREEMANSMDDWDSALDFSRDSSETVDDDDVEVPLVSHKKFSRTSKKEWCCYQHFKPKEETERLQKNLNALREQVDSLLIKSTNIEERISNLVPKPPPLPRHMCSTPVTDRIQMSGKSFEKERPNMNSILQDLTNIKFTPIRKKSSSNQQISLIKGDIRNDLYEILKRRYAVTHSPHPIRLKVIDNFEGSDEENSLTSATLCVQRQCVMSF
ncbi:hypothetical protein ILUMI_22106 [Ignelater luminosus]|uniref:Uncharacterized protein n=1 Tax=Ignelater luminosus TaxID=2038154 RepID=A0A8K0G2X6_IGNLU|nr:hypothetical protein ILUMI_22106 [Ignelater luminosus]